jgi:hypothetical protein
VFTFQEENHKYNLISEEIQQNRKSYSSNEMKQEKDKFSIFQRENRLLKLTNENLTSENIKLKNEIEKIYQEIEIKALKSENLKIKNKLQCHLFSSEIKTLQVENEKLKSGFEMIAELHIKTSSIENHLFNENYSTFDTKSQIDQNFLEATTKNDELKSENERWNKYRTQTDCKYKLLSTKSNCLKVENEELNKEKEFIQSSQDEVNNLKKARKFFQSKNTYSKKKGKNQCNDI